MAKTLTGKASWFNHGVGEPGPGPPDHGNKGQASGISFDVPGIAVDDTSTLRGYWHVQGVGKSFDIQQTDVGPAKSTGRIVDFTWLAVQRYLDGKDPTGQTFTITFLGMKGANSPGSTASGNTSSSSPTGAAAADAAGAVMGTVGIAGLVIAAFILILGIFFFI